MNFKKFIEDLDNNKTTEPQVSGSTYLPKVQEEVVEPTRVEIEYTEYKYKVSIEIKDFEADVELTSFEMGEIKAQSGEETLEAAIFKYFMDYLKSSPKHYQVKVEKIVNK